MTKTFCIEFETGLSKKGKDLCEKKLRIGRSMYNAFLCEGLKRVHKYQNDERYISLSKEYKDARNLKTSLLSLIKQYKDNNASSSEIKLLEDRLRQNDRICLEYSAAMMQIRKEYKWTGKFSLSDFRKEQSHHFKGAIGAQVAVRLSERAYRTVKKFEKGLSDKIIFAKDGDDFSIEGASNLDSIYLKGGMLYFDKKTCINIKPARKNDEVYYSEAMAHQIKYCRLLSRTIRGKKRYYVQAIMEGTPPIRRKYGEGRIELDVKISHLKMKIQDQIETIELAPGCKEIEDKIAEIDSKMEASRKANNPDNYDDYGAIKTGAKNWVNSNNHKKMAARKKELYRALRERRKVAHEELSNQILEKGSEIYIKQLPYKRYQESFRKLKPENDPDPPISIIRQGKNIRSRAPASFILIHERKLSYIGKQLIELIPEGN